MTVDPDRMKHSADTYPRWVGGAYYTPTSDGEALGWTRLVPEGDIDKLVLRVADDDSIVFERVDPDGIVEVLFTWHPT